MSVKLLTRLETLEHLVSSDVSLARLGDGEVNMLFDGKSIHFQHYSPQLQEKFRNLLKHQNSKLLLAYNNQFAQEDENLVIRDLERSAKPYARLLSYRESEDIGVLDRSEQKKMYQHNLSRLLENYQMPLLGDATLFFIGYYVDEYKNNTLEKVFDLYRSLWSGKRVLFVGPENPLMSVSFAELINTGAITSPAQTFFEQVPNENAFETYDEICNRVASYKDKVDKVCLQIGPTATVMAHELTEKHNMTVYDVGSLNQSLAKVNANYGYTF